MNIVLRRPLLLSLPPHGGHPNRGAGLKTASELIWMIEDMKHETHNDAQAVLHALLAEGCGPGARSARLDQDDELADFLCKAQDDIVPEAKRLLAQRWPSRSYTALPPRRFGVPTLRAAP